MGFVLRVWGMVFWCGVEGLGIRVQGIGLEFGVRLYCL